LGDSTSFNENTSPSPKMLAFLALAVFTFPLGTLAQLASLPQCIQSCIEKSPDTNCDITDVGCICRASAGSFLTDTVVCIRSNCDNNLDINVLLTTIELACDIAGSPIPDSAIQSAENVASSTAAVTTTTSGGSGPTSTGAVTVTQPHGSSTVTIVYPITEWRTTTVSGPGSTVTSISTTSALGTVSTYTATDSEGHTTTQKTTITETMTQSSSSSSHSSSSRSSDLTKPITTTAVAQAVSSSVTKPKPSSTSTPDDDASDSAPFKNTNSASKIGVKDMLGLSGLVMMGILWV